MTLLAPNAFNYAMRYYSFLITRGVITIVGLDIIRQIDSATAAPRHAPRRAPRVASRYPAADRAALLAIAQVGYAAAFLIGMAGLLHDNLRTLRAMNPALPRSASGVELSGPSSPYVKVD